MEFEITRTSNPQRDLLLLADESSASVDAYIDAGICFIARLEGRNAGAYGLHHTRPFTAELVHLALASEFQHKRIGTAMLAHTIGPVRAEGFRILELETGDRDTEQLTLDERCDFCCGIDRDYYRKYDPTPVLENGIECRNWIRLRMEFA